ncbi:MAG: ABC transporter permease [Erysipelotrichaceae bacterium]
MLWIIKKEIIYCTRYKMMTINRYLYPFFMIAPYLIMSKQFNVNYNIIDNLILWIWMCQLMYGISSGISEVKLEGTFVNIMMAPISIFKFLFFKYLFHVIDCSIITFVTLSLTYVFLGVGVGNILLFCLYLILFSFFLFCFSIMFAGLAIKFIRINEINYFLQQVFGVLSGYTSPIIKLPYFVRFFSYCIPLTYSILVVNNMDAHYNLMLITICLMMSIGYLIFGYFIIKKETINMRKRGDVELW